ncbi:MAG TPA: type II secretion system protein GspG [Gemmataceae bacterium]|nr:type II secretion system protein GspG [Gemmataceae bacterium]
MKTTIIVSAVAFSTLFTFGAPDPDKLFKDAMKAVEETTAILKSVKDKASAEAAVPKLEESISRLLAAHDVMDKIQEGTNEELNAKLQKVRKEFGKQAGELHKALGAEMARVGKQPDLQKVLLQSKSWAKFDGLLQQSRLDRARLDVKSLELAVTTYYVKYGEWPPTLKQLAQRDPKDNSPAFLASEAVLIDPWDRPYEYEPNTLHPKTEKPLIYSHGPDPKDKNGRIANWNDEPKGDKKIDAGKDKHDQRVKSDIRWLELGVRAYYIRHDYLPKNLATLIVKDAIDGSPALLPPWALLDPWGRLYQYVSYPPQPLTKRPLIFSYGPDPKDNQGKIVNWDLKAKPAASDNKAGKVGADAESILKDALKTMNEITALLKKINDKETARAAAPQLDASTKKLHAAFATLHAIGSGDTALRKSEEKLAQQWDDALTAFDAETLRLVGQPALFPNLLEFSVWDLRLTSEVWVRYLHQRSYHRARVNVKLLENAVIAYKNNFGQFPANLHDLAKRQADGNAFVAEKALNDPWHFPIVYQPNNRHPKTDIPLIYSGGYPGDGIRVSNWDPAEMKKN